MSVRVAWEHHFQKAEDVSGYLGEAKRLLLEQGLNPDAMDATLAQVVNLLAAKQVQFEQVGSLGILDGMRRG